MANFTPENRCSTFFSRTANLSLASNPIKLVFYRRAVGKPSRNSENGKKNDIGESKIFPAAGGKPGSMRKVQRFCLLFLLENLKKLHKITQDTQRKRLCNRYILSEIVALEGVA
jgi:hypothetical protein